MHGLKILTFIAVRNGGIHAAYFRGKRPAAGTAAHHAGPQLLAVLHHEQAVVGQASDDTIGPVDDQAAAGLFKLLEQGCVGVFFQVIILQRGDDVFVGFEAQPQLGDGVVQDVGKNL
jgi:hypothetical protein